jgi:hypothetical protein
MEALLQATREVGLEVKTLYVYVSSPECRTES